MNLTDLVTDTLVPESSSEEVVEEKISVVVRSKTTSGSLLHRGKALLESMQEAEGIELHKQASLLAALFSSFGKDQTRPLYSYSDQAQSAKNIGPELFARAADYLHSGTGRDNLLAFVRQSLDSHYLLFFFSDAHEHISYLESFWGEDTADKLALLGGVQKSTARNWMRGSSPYSAKYSLYRAVKVLYHLGSSAGIGGEAARDWMDAPLNGGKTPFEFIVSSNYQRWSTNADGKIVLDDLTLALEDLGIEAFSWTIPPQYR